MSVVCLALVACSVYAAVSEDVVASYVDAFEKYQVKFDKHYDTKEEYDRRLRAYAVCFLFFFQDVKRVVNVITLYAYVYVYVRPQWRK